MPADEPEQQRTPLLDAEFMRKLERISLAARRVRLGAARGERRSRRKGISTEFADYRNYVQGDDLRHIDWNIVGRLDALYLKLFEEQEDLTLHVLIDASLSMGYGDPPKLAMACQLAAALGYIALVNFDRVTVEAFSEAGVQELRPTRGKASTHKLFDFIEQIAAGGATTLEASTRGHFLRSRGKGVVVLLSDFFDPDGHEGVLRRMTMSGSDVYVIHVLSREEIDPPVTGDLKLLDAETGEFTEVSVSPTLLKRYRENVAAFCESIRRFCVARGIGYTLAPSDTDIERLSLEMLRSGGLLQ
jgi:uncharacterized protein (DUF58 family)